MGSADFLAILFLVFLLAVILWFGTRRGARRAPGGDARDVAPAAGRAEPRKAAPVAGREAPQEAAAAAGREAPREAAPEPAAASARTETSARSATPSPTPASTPEGGAAALESDLSADDDLALIKDCFDEVQRRATALGLPSVFLEAYRHIRTWAPSFAPGRRSPAILSEPEVIRGNPTTYRFKLKNRPYSIVKTHLGEDRDVPGSLLHERLQFVDASGTTLFEMELLTADYGSEERPGSLTAFVEGAWVEDLRELNVLFGKDASRISDDFRKKFRAKEAERLKRDFGA